MLLGREVKYFMIFVNVHRLALQLGTLTEYKICRRNNRNCVIII